MKKQVDPKLIIAAAAVLVVLLSVLGWHFLGPTGDKVDKSQLNQATVKEQTFK